MNLEVYTRPTCSDCQAAKVFLSEHNIAYTEFDLMKQFTSDIGKIRKLLDDGSAAFYIPLNTHLGYGIIEWYR